jgi:glutamyl/glutaminyl-tRNA synthetase
MKIIMEKEGILRYDDPRMATMKSFKRRGIRPETIRKLIFETGISMNEVNIDMKMIAAYNKEFVGEVNEYPFFEEAVGIEIYNFAPGVAECYGTQINFDSPIETIIIDKKELQKFKDGDIVRMKKGFNIKFTEVSEYGAKAQFISYSKTENNHPILSWMKQTIDTEILMNDGTIKRGISSSGIEKEKSIVRFEEIGYANMEETKEGKTSFVYSYL